MCATSGLEVASSVATLPPHEQATSPRRDQLIEWKEETAYLDYEAGPEERTQVLRFVIDVPQALFWRTYAELEGV
jgi:hypothetical protein